MPTIPIWANYALAAILCYRGWSLMETAIEREHSIARVTRNRIGGAVISFILAGYLVGYALGLWGHIG